MADPKMRARARAPESNSAQPSDAEPLDALMRLLAPDPAAEAEQRRARAAAAEEELQRAAEMAALKIMARGPAPGDPIDDMHAQMTRGVAESAEAQNAVAATLGAGRRRVVKPGTPPVPATEPARALQAETDLLSKDYEEAATAIAALRLGVSGEVEIARQSDPDDVAELTWSLRFFKEGKEWVLKIIKTTNAPEDWIEDELDVARAPRWIRKLVVGKLPALVAQLHKNVETELEDVKSTRAQVAAFTASLKKGAP